MIRISWLLLGVSLLLTSVGKGQSWNSPYGGRDDRQNTYYVPTSIVPKTLDPARAFSADEYQIIAQIYEPPLQYHYLKRPFQLIPLTALQLPTVTYYDASGHRLPTDAELDRVAYSVYDMAIRPGIYYQPHPAFAKNAQGEFLYHHLSRRDIQKKNTLGDFNQVGTRELRADDYVYQIKRLASPRVHSPIFGLMSHHILGMSSYSQQLEKVLLQKNPTEFLDLRDYPLEGVKIVSPYHYQIKIKGVYPQFRYWLAMTFFSPIPWEADAFYSQPGMADKNITLDWYPIGTGPYQLAENNPNRQMVLIRNPYFHDERYPNEGQPSDREKGYLADAGKQLPFINKVVFILDKESIPRWNKFLQGYYDKSSISAESFEQAIQIDERGRAYVTPSMKQQGIQLQTAVLPAIFYFGFNMLDPVVGGYDEKRQKLRQAIAIAIDYEEYIAIFRNGRGLPAEGPIPPGIFGYTAGREGMNPYVYRWAQGKVQRRSLAEAKRLLAEAGYPNGIDPKTHRPLLLYYDATMTGSPEDKAYFHWIRKQFAKLGIHLDIRATLYNRFQDKMRQGNAQMFSWGWLPDYPDPEDFLFLLYGPNGKVKYGGENATNYGNPAADQLFEMIRILPDGPERQKKINEWLAIVRKDSPWAFGFYPIQFTLSHAWNNPTKLHPVANNTIKYARIDANQRAQLRNLWNKPIVWPLLVLLGFLVALFIPLIIIYWQREHRPTIRRGKF